MDYKVSLISVLSSAPVPVIATGAALVILVGAFIGAFLTPALLHLRRLGNLRKALARCAADSPIDAVTAVFASTMEGSRQSKQYFNR